MDFNPATTAAQVFKLVQASDELGEDLAAAVEAEERFSSSAGQEGSEAYRELVAIGARHPEADAFLEFLAYITWSHLLEETMPEHFQRGADLCKTLIQRDSGGNAERLERLRKMERSFRAGLGEKSEDDSKEVMDYDADVFEGGD